MLLDHLSPDHRDRVRQLLVANELPVGDLDDPTNELIGAFDGEDLLGVVGLQRCDGVGLLRSLAVAEARRANGIGRLLCEHVVATARAHGYTDLYLLTTGAADYFARQGFSDVGREDVPAAIRMTAQFAGLCPASARVMRRRIVST